MKDDLLPVPATPQIFNDRQLASRAEDVVSGLCKRDVSHQCTLPCHFLTSKASREASDSKFQSGCIERRVLSRSDHHIRQDSQNLPPNQGVLGSRKKNGILLLYVEI